MSEKIVFSRGSFFHGTRADLKMGDLIVTGKKKNYNDDRKSQYVYFAGTLDAAIWGAELAEGGEVRKGYMLSSQQVILKMTPMLQTRNFRGTRQNRIDRKNL